MKFRKRETLPDEQGYYRTVPVADLSPDKVSRLKVKDLDILVTLYQGAAYAFSAYCPHAAGNLADGHLYRGRIDCPEHAYRFDIRSGEILWPDDESYCLKTFPTKIVDGAVLLKITD